MASSTSSSSAAARVTQRAWHVLLLKALCLTTLLFGAWEGAWRARGFTPCVRNDYELWAHTLKGALEHNQQSIAFIGASRSMQGVSIPALRRLLPQRFPAQLGCAGGSPLPTLELLATATSFAGTVVVDIMPMVFFTEETSDSGRTIDHTWPQRFRQQLNDEALLTEPYCAPWERSINQWLQQHFVAAAGHVTPGRILSALKRGKLPSPPHWYVTPERMQILDYTLIDDVEAFRKSRYAMHSERTPLDPKALQKRLNVVQGWIQQIEERGGRVLFVRFPTQGGVRAVEEQRFSRSEYWDPTLHALGAERVLNAAADPVLNSYAMGDEDHIDVEEAPSFTAELSKRLFT